MENSTSNVVNEIVNSLKNIEELPAGGDPLPILTRMAEIIEVETENYLKMDPDPFDERHPYRTDPECKLGQILKIVFRKDTFMTKLLNDYLRDTYYSRLNITDKDIDQLNIAGARLLLDLMPGLEISVVFQDMESLINRLIKWVTDAKEPLKSYATGLLGSSMEIPEIATKFREANGTLIPILLNRLKGLKDSSEFAAEVRVNQYFNRPFAHLASGKSPSKKETNNLSNSDSSFNNSHEELSPSGERRQNFLGKRKRENTEGKATEQSNSDVQQKRRKKVDDAVVPLDTNNGTRRFLHFSENSNSSWAELENFMIGNVQMFPPTMPMRQILILRYLTATGEYQEFLGHAFHNNIALELILCYVNVRATKEARLAFEALKYLAALLCHKKFSIEFIQIGGMKALLDVPRPSISATGVSVCLYYLGYCEEAMERICQLPDDIITDLVTYALWLLECSHESGRCHAIMFFGLTFQYKIILDEFDAQDGIRKLFNVVSTLPILMPDGAPPSQQGDDQACAARQIVRHVCVAYRRYLEAHLYIKAQAVKRSLLRHGSDKSFSLLPQNIPSYKPCKLSPEEIQQNIELLLQYMPYRSHWTPVDQLMKLGCITLLLKIIAFAYEWNFSGRAETVRSALDVLAVSCVLPKVQLLFCEKVDLPEETITIGFNIILGAAEGEIVADPDVQKSALRVLVNCVCGPSQKTGSGPVARLSLHHPSTSSPNKKLKYKTCWEELIQKVWDCVRSNNGIMVFIQLMNVKTPITDADCIRTLACKALTGLARSDTVKQIVSKLPLFTTGQLQNLMKDPILQEKRLEHVAFQKYALELLERLSGKTKQGNNDLELSLANIHKIHRANIVAQTKIQFNEKQLMQLIYQHLVAKNYNETAALLMKEANLTSSLTNLQSTQLPSKFRYSATLTPTRSRKSLSNTSTSVSLRGIATPTTASCSTDSTGSVNNSGIIKIVKKSSTLTTGLLTPTFTQNSRLQKQVSCETPFIRSPVSVNILEEQANNDRPRITLESIITEYLTNQHALCKNPMATCPQFNLFTPHKCPDPRPKLITANNFVTRCARRALGYQSKAMDRRFIHSRFRAMQTIRFTNMDGFFTCAKFLPGKDSIIVSDYNGDIRLYNTLTANEETNFSAHDNYIVSLEPNRTGEILLTTCTWGRPTSVLWGLKDFDLKIAFNEEEHVEFSKVAQDRVIGTKAEIATIYDINTGGEIMKLIPTISNQYTKNKATFSMNDELVLSDGVLFDANSGKAIHKLDKLNQNQSGVFNPNGLEIISNTEVWDIRTFHLLKTVPVLNQSSITFASTHNVLYAITMERESEDSADEPAFDTSFKTVDSNEYSSIATIDVKRNIYDLAINSYDTQIAIVENQGMYNSVQESVVRIYDVGRGKDDEDEEAEEDEDDEEEIPNSDDDGSDGDVIINISSIGNTNEANNAENNEENNDDGESSSSDSDSSWTNITDSDSSSSTALSDLLYEY